MITKITMADVASYKAITTLETDKKVNLIYGLNGAGKSTLSRYLYEPGHTDFKSCKTDGTPPRAVMVYNTRFVQEYFHEQDRLHGIFTLSKENKAAEEAIKSETALITEKGGILSEKNEALKSLDESIAHKKQQSVDTIWAIKTKYTGGDRVLEFCLDGLKGKKETLFDYIAALPKPEDEPGKTIESLKQEVALLSNDTVTRIEPILPIELDLIDIEKSELFSRSIAGNTTSQAAALISTLKNSDWVKSGLSYLPEVISEENHQCPFCQEHTITRKLITEIESYFDKSYEEDITTLRQHLTLYKEKSENLPSLANYINIPILSDYKASLELAHGKLAHALTSNLGKVEAKVASPSKLVQLSDSSKLIDEVNSVISQINAVIDAHNEKLQNKAHALSSLKHSFWERMRWDYDQTISVWIAFEKENQEARDNLNAEIVTLTNQVEGHKAKIRENQKLTVNVDEAVEHINQGLLSLGIDSFTIIKHDENRYRVVRPGMSSGEFHTLSEGEKTVISFLYFVELCKGRKTADDISEKRIVVIDDPISSLSHIFIFHIGRMILREFFSSDSFLQVFVLTHSLYFFYELTDTNHKRRKDTQNLFRITKNSLGSTISPMKYEEIQNDYQSYWTIILDPDHPPALIANCMRNTIEYFFTFVRKRDLNNVFQSPELLDDKFQAFYRFMNRESHSIGQNIFDFKEFDYEVFKEGHRLVFEVSGYRDHYEAMTQ